MQYGRFLAVDTASSHLTVLAQNGDKVSLKYTPDCALRHSVALMGEVESALEEAGLRAADCDFFCAVTGPGSFTGIRIGVSAAKGFALATGKPAMPLTAFELVAYNVSGGDFYAVADAAHGHVYACRFTGGVAGQPKYMPCADIDSSGLPAYGYQNIALANYTVLDPSKLLAKAVEAKLAGGQPFGELRPLYVRKSQAEEGRK